MKKLFALLFLGIMIFSLEACGQNKKDNNAGNENSSAITSGEAESSGNAGEESGSAETLISGGWSHAESPVVPEEVKSLLEQAAEKMTGADYVPCAYIGSQVVAGTNHALLCKVTPVVPDAKTRYSLVILYEDLEGNAEITDVRDCEAPAPQNKGLLGGWSDSDSPVMTEEAEAALEKAVKELAGAKYRSVALLGTQVVAGTNYSILCEITAAVPEAEPFYSVLIVYEDLEGNAAVTDTFDFAAEE